MKWAMYFLFYNIDRTDVNTLLKVSTDGGGSVLGSATSVPLGFEIPGHLPGLGLVPVSLPFQFPQLLKLPSLGATGSTIVASSSATNTNLPFSTLTQSE